MAFCCHEHGTSFTLVTIGHLNTNNGHSTRMYNVPPHTNSLYSDLFIPPAHSATRNTTGKTDVMDGNITAPEKEAGSEIPVIALAAGQPLNIVPGSIPANDGGSNTSL